MPKRGTPRSASHWRPSYNTLHQFTTSRLLREVVVETGRSYFDTNTSDHHHFFHETSGRLHDIEGGRIDLAGLPSVPDGTRISRVDVVIRLADESGSEAD